jgi:hypothetical protein
MSKRAKIAFSIALLAVIVIAVVIPAFIRAYSTPSSAPCVNRLMQIDGAKQEWAIEKGKTTNDVPTWDGLYPYLSSSFTNRWFTNGTPVCPEGGTYTLDSVGVHPTCSIGGERHSFPK